MAMTAEQMLKGEIPEGMTLVRKIDQWDEGGPIVYVIRRTNITQEEVERNRRKMQGILDDVIRGIALQEAEKAMDEKAQKKAAGA